MFISVTNIEGNSIITEVFGRILKADSNIIKVVYKVLVIHEKDSIILLIIISDFVLSLLFDSVPNWIGIAECTLPL